MDRMPLPPESFFEGTPPHVCAYNEQLQTTLADLHTRIAELKTRQAKNSTNSSLPPSSEHPHAKPTRSTLARYAETAASLATPSTNGFCSPPSNASASSLACRRPAAAALHP
jgi:hypothetical protein